MSVEAIAIVLNHSVARGTPKVVLLGIANHDGDGGAYPKLRTLARYARVSERSTQRALEELVDLGELRIEYRAGGDRDVPEHERPNRYHILVVCPETCDRTKQHRTRLPVNPPTPASPGAPDADVAALVTPMSPAPVTPASPQKPSLEPTTPQPPASGGLEGEPCPKHKHQLGRFADGCRGCGTTPRQIAAREDRRKRTEARLAAQERAVLEQQIAEAARVAPERIARDAEQIRRRLRRPAPVDTGAMR